MTRTASADTSMPPPASRPRPRVLGLIGGIGAGKSTVARELAALGAFVLEADDLAHELLEQPWCQDAVARRFGEHFVKATGTGGRAVDRRALGDLVFADGSARRDLEAILHPAMRRATEERIANAPADLVVLDAAILLEAGWDDLCDRIVFVDAPAEVRRERVRSGRGWSDEKLAAREAAQWDLDVKRRRADDVIVNDGDLDHVRRQCRRLVGSIAPRPL